MVTCGLRLFEIIQLLLQIGNWNRISAPHNAWNNICPFEIEPSNTHFTRVRNRQSFLKVKIKVLILKQVRVTRALY
jgi:hypothetical protein